MNKKINLIIWIIAVVAVLGAAYVFYSRYRGSGQKPSIYTKQNASPDTVNGNASSKNDDLAAPDFSLKDLKGNDVSLKDYRGKIVILNFWAVWCKYCKLEMPDLNSLNKELGNKSDVVILAVDVQESADTINNYLDSNKFDLKVLMDSDGSVANSYGVNGYPNTFIINKDGTVYTYIPGATDKATLIKIIDMIREGKPLK